MPETWLLVIVKDGSVIRFDSVMQAERHPAYSKEDHLLYGPESFEDWKVSMGAAYKETADLVYVLYSRFFGWMKAKDVSFGTAKELELRKQELWELLQNRAIKPNNWREGNMAKKSAAAVEEKEVEAPKATKAAKKAKPAPEPEPTDEDEDEDEEDEKPARNRMNPNLVIRIVDDEKEVPARAGSKRHTIMSAAVDGMTSGDFIKKVTPLGGGKADLEILVEKGYLTLEEEDAAPVKKGKKK